MYNNGRSTHDERVEERSAETVECEGGRARLTPDALRELHSLPPRDCPFTMTLPVTLRLARERVAAGLIDAGGFDPERRGQSAAQLLTRLVQERPQTEDIVLLPPHRRARNTSDDPVLVKLMVDIFPLLRFEGVQVVRFEYYTLGQQA